MTAILEAGGGRQIKLNVLIPHWFGIWWVSACPCCMTSNSTTRSIGTFGCIIEGRIDEKYHQHSERPHHGCIQLIITPF